MTNNAGSLASSPVRPAKIGYVDRLRVLMTVLVIFHHTAVTYGAPGGWYLKQQATGQGALTLLTWFVATNQSFFMGFFFFLSALFTPGAYDKKGPARFLTDRLKRLGIPLLVYSLVISPLTIWLVQKYQRGIPSSFSGFINGFDDWIDFGVLWFVAALLLFTLIYVILRKWFGKSTREFPFPGRNRIIVFAIAIGLTTYLVRIFIPIGWVLKPFGFQPAHFPQYIALYSLGLLAARNNWTARLPVKDNRFWITISACLVFLGFPGLYLIKMVTGAPFSAYTGGTGVLSLLNSVWEQLTGFCIIMALSGWFKSKDRPPGAVLRGMTRSAYAVYIIHPLILVSFTVIALHWPVAPQIKFLVVAPLAAVCCFLSGAVLVRIPGFDKVL